MANPTTNFGWQMPTSTDLVTDLPADFEVFGQAVDTALVDLKGGTTGQVLSKASNTNMDFTWVTTDDANAIQNTIVDAKGDLIAASAADTPARLAVGTNGQTLVADSTASTGLAWATPASGSTFAGCSVYKSANQSITSSTQTILTFNTELFDTNSYHDNATNNSRITIPSGKAGYYSITLRATFANNATGVRVIYLAKNGTNVMEVDRSIVSNNEYETVLATVVYYCSVADYFEAKVWQSSGGALNILADDPSTSFSMSYLGA